MARRLQDVLEGKRGFAASGWEALDLSDEVSINPLVSWGSSGGEGLQAAHAVRPTPLSDSDGAHCVAHTSLSRLVLTLSQ